MESKTMQKEQLEIRFEGGRPFRCPVRKQRRQSRARWWFSQMRQVVDHVRDWQPELVARSEPVLMPFSQTHGRQ